MEPIMKKLDRAEAERKLQGAIHQIETLKTKEPLSIEFKTWQRETRLAIRHIFGGDSRNLAEFDALSFVRGIYQEAIATEEQRRETFDYGLEGAKALLGSMLKDLCDYG